MPEVERSEEIWCALVVGIAPVSVPGGARWLVCAIIHLLLEVPPGWEMKYDPSNSACHCRHSLQAQCLFYRAVLCLLVTPESSLTKGLRFVQPACCTPHTRMESANPQNDTPKPCTGGCGFYGSAPLDFYCSLCFKKAKGEAEFMARTRAKAEEEDKKLAAAAAAAAGAAGAASEAAQPALDKEVLPSPEPLAVEEPTPEPLTPEPKAVEEPTPEPAAAGSPVCPVAGAETPKKKPTNKCWTCNKKVGLTGFHCRCDGVFCGVHRYSDKHECTFDYKALGREQLTKANPTVAAEKLERI